MPAVHTARSMSSLYGCSRRCQKQVSSLQEITPNTRGSLFLPIRCMIWGLEALIKLCSFLRRYGTLAMAREGLANVTAPCGMPSCKSASSTSTPRWPMHMEAPHDDMIIYRHGDMHAVYAYTTVMADCSHPLQIRLHVQPVT